MKLNPNILLLTTSLLMTSLSACTPSGSEAAGSATAAARTEPRALATAATPPDAAQRPHTVTAPHGAQRSDEYYWLRDDKRQNPEMLAYLQAENAYADAVLAPLQGVQNRLYEEIVARIKQDDSSVPYRERGWWYYSRFETGKDYPIHARRADANGVDALSIQRANEAGDFSGEQVLLDVNTLAEGKDFYQVGGFTVSQDNRLLAWAEDLNGRRQYTVRFIDLDSGKTLPDTISGTSGDLVWADDNRTLLYGYGGFEISLTPGYSGGVGKGWLEKGGIYAVANIRGGGEYGPRWHQAALKANRHKAYEDFAAVAQDLIARKITSPKHLGIQGGSNGGLLTGNMLTQYPELFGAVVVQVPLLDMKRYSHLLAGASWMAEYGNPDTADWEFIQTFSPYHLFDAKKDYPPTLFMTSTRDDRVHPGHARKMAAKMLDAGKDVRYYENIEGGHGGAANNAQAAHMSALAYTFLWQQLTK